MEPDMSQYLDENGNPIAAPAKVYLDDNGEPIKQTVTPTPGAVLRAPTDRERFLNPEFYPVGVKGEGVGENLKNLAQRAGVGVFQLADALANPRQTVAGMLSSVLPEPVVKGVNKVVDLENKIPGAHYLTTKLPEGVPNPIASAYQALAPGGWTAVGNVAPTVGQILAGGAFGEAGAGILDDVKAGNIVKDESVPKVARFLANTGKGTAKDLVEKTKATRELVGEKAKDIESKDVMEAARQRNKEKVAAEGHENSTQDARAKAEADHNAAQKEFFRKKAEHKAATEKTEAENRRLTQEHNTALEQHGKLQSSLNEGERSAKVDLNKVEERVHTDADKLYKNLKPKLASYEADPESTAEIVDRAHENMSALESKPPLFEKFDKLVKNKGGSLTYDELDDARSRIGAAMRKGSLSGGTFHLYEVMLEGDPETGVPGIIDEMDRIAKDHGLTEDAGAARNAWRTWAEAFRDRQSPLRSILHDPEVHGLLGNMRGQQSYLARLRAFGPDGAHLADRIEKDISTAHGSKAQFTKYGTIEVPPPKPPKLGDVKPFTEREPEYKQPQVGPAPNPIQRTLTSGSPMERATAEVGKPTTVGTKELTQANREAIAAKEKKARTGYSPLLTSISVFDAIRNAMRGDWAAVGLDVGARGAYEVGKQGYAALLRNQKVIEFLSKPTAQQIAQVPLEMRGADLQPILDAAKKQGIKVDPRIYAIAGAAAPKKTPGDLLRQSQ